MSLEPSFQLKQTNVSQPHLSHSSSQRSIAASQAASEGYYSLNSASAASSGDGGYGSSRPTPGRSYHTPPSQQRTPASNHGPDAPITHLKGVGIPRQNPLAAAHPSLPPPQSASRTSPQPSTDMDSESLATTPGMDTTPYIRFAIDQITRDEEVRGSRMYPMGLPPQDDDDDDYPVERTVPDDGLGYMAQETKKNHRISRPLQQPPPPQPLQPPPASLPPLPSQPLRQLPLHPPPASGPSVVQKNILKDALNDAFVATTLPHAPLRFLPAILRPFWLGFFALLCLAMAAALVFSAVHSHRSSTALWAYGSFGDVRYFIFEYLPALLGALLLLWLIQVRIALQRVAPFIAMASASPHQRSQASFLQMYPMQFFLPNLEHFTAGQPLVGLFNIASWMFVWTIPLLSSSYNVRYDVTGRIWRWVAVQGVIWTAIALYIFLILTLLAIAVFLARKETGLKWDPRSLADLVVLLERSNIMDNYSGSETFDTADFRQKLGRQTDRLGYWITSRRPNDVFYGIGKEGGPTRRYSLEDGRIREKASEEDHPHDGLRAEDFSIRMNLRSPRVRLKYLPWYLRETSVIAYIVAICALFIAFVVVSYLNASVRRGFAPAVSPLTDASGFSASNFLYSFIPATIGLLLFLAILTYDYSLRTLRPYISLSSIGGATAETSLLVDYAARLPLSVTMSALENRHYQTAVLSFSSLCSLSLPILAGGCFWTQYYPNEATTVRVAADIPAYYALCFFLALYAVSLFFLLPGRRRAALPHRSTSLADVISWLYKSPLVTDRAFSRPQTKPELVARLMGSAYLERTWAQSLTSLVGRRSRADLHGAAQPPPPPQSKEKSAVEKREMAGSRTTQNVGHDGALTEKHTSSPEPREIRYGFGIYIGRDGLEHLGIDRVSRRGERSGRELVIYEEQRQQGRDGNA